MSNETVERTVTIDGEDVFTTRFPADYDEGRVGEFAADIKGMVDAFKDHVARGKVGAQHYSNILFKDDPACAKGHALYYQDHIKDAKNYVRLVCGVTEAAISRHFTELREGLDPAHPWYLDPNRTETTGSGGVAKGTKRGSTKPVDPEAFTLDQLLAAVKARLESIDKEVAGLPNAISTLTEVESVVEAGQRASGILHGFIRTGGKP